MATKPTAGVNTCPTSNQGGGSSSSNNNPNAGAVSGSSGVGDVKKSTKAHVNTILLKSVSAFLASSKRNSSNPSRASEVSVKTSRRLKKKKMDELSGKINPKLLEQLRKKTRFSK